MNDPGRALITMTQGMAVDGAENLSKLLASELTQAQRGFRAPLLVALDGPDCAGKSTVGRHLVAQLKDQHSVLLVHFDDYLNPKGVREARGEFSVDGFTNDFFDERALIRSVLEPAMREKQSQDAFHGVVVVEGLFLLRPPLRHYFDIAFRMEISEEQTLRRALARDVGVLGSEEWVKQHYLLQCIPAQRMYRQQVVGRDRTAIRIHCNSDDTYEVDCEQAPAG